MANVQVAAEGTDALVGGAGDDLLIAGPLQWTADFVALDASGFTGRVTIDQDGGQLRVVAVADGLVPGQSYALAIHGLSEIEGAPVDSLAGASGLDADDDGAIGQAELEAGIGPSLLELEPQVAAANGNIGFDQSFDLAALDANAALFPLEFRAVELSAPGGPPAAVAELAPVDGSGAAEGVALAGAGGNDVLVGGAGDDLLVGGTGDDVLVGGGGDDSMVGNGGADRFVVGQGRDAITGFNPGDGDRVDFGHDADSAVLRATQTPQGLWLTIGDGAANAPGTEGVILVGIQANATTDIGDWLV
ncbi:hypothetical protein [Magnetospirillum sp. UT-4]|uniref:hypothetical protein n=1 Tax=Magnetospirillum sp. UT-4 TaxID=2681467 RepID=UPI001380B9B8|nr:hypothetical protein [Magnetospirillum sp. UT-4]CAA7624279.1 conserved hypothetical protein [Magnetospirillum sp. UT-4]